ncbi:hypothetical protein [Aliarcobacter butzleri]|uniref:hypothetical protein n=1 Tax=Aliarcobacter butzleri TaxID=28197 RepID=UPI00189EFC96|nr:hypothetical protein [Aliarcobacter butzleri]MBF7066496.1 hypothetical protein [Aliarcobacter butzleri]
MSWTYINQARKSEKISYKVLKKIENIERFTCTFFFEKDEIPLIIKLNVFKDIKDKIEKEYPEKLNISDEIKEKIFNYLKNKFEEFSLDDLFHETYNEIYLFSRFQNFEVSLDKISKEINEYMFETPNNFFKILEKFKYWQLSTSGSEWLINKEVLGKLVDLEEVQKYIDDLDDEIKNGYKEVLEIWDKS